MGKEICILLKLNKIIDYEKRKILMNNGLKIYSNSKINYSNKLNLEKIKNKVNSYDIISFDIFDTLIKRNLNDALDIFKVIEIDFNRKFSISIEKFKQKRIAAEKKARENCKRKEITLIEIYDCFDDEIIKNNKNNLIKIEEMAEVELCTAHKEIQELYYWCLNNGKRIILTSDMYLSLEIIERMLEKCKYKGYEKIYLSSYNNARKSTGDLYKLIKSELGVNSKRIYHIGDSFKSDGIKARKEGIYSSVIPLNINKTSFFDLKKINSNTNFEYSQLYKFCNNNIDETWNEYMKFGYEVFGTVLYGFSEWLMKELNKEKIDKVFFFARDGLIMKEAFEIFNLDKKIKSYYLEVSRRSLRVPQLWMNPEYSEVINSFSAASMHNVRSFFDTLGLDINEYKALCNELGISLDYKFKKKNMLKDTLLINLYSRIKEDVIKNSKTEYDILLKYLKSKNFNGKIAVVDIGWRGSMQKFLLNIVSKSNISIEMKGYYIGLAEGAIEYKKQMDIDLNGYIFDCTKNPNEKDIRQPFVGLIETLFLAQSGSCKSYYIDDSNEVKVNYYENEYYENGKLTLSAKNVIKIQQGALKFISDFININKECYFNVSKIIAIENLRRIGVSPTNKELLMFADMEFLDGDIEKLAAPASIIKYLSNPKKLINDFYRSRWKIGFMKRLFKIPLPYEKLYEMMKKI